MRDYELTYIVHPQVDQEELDGVVKGIESLVETNGGTVHKVESWGLRRLAYPIRKLREGHYIFMTVGLEAQSVPEIERMLKLNESVIRHLIVRTDES